MEGRLAGFNAHLQHNQVYSTPWSNYPNISIQAVEGGFWSGRSVGGESEILRELEKKRIREEILAREYVMEREMRAGGFSSSFLQGRPDNYHHRFQPRLLDGQPVDRTGTPFLEDYGGSGRHSGELTRLMDRRTALPFQEDYGGRGRQQGEIVSFDAVPLQQRAPKVKEVITSCPKAGQTGAIGLRTTESMSGTKRIPPPAAGPTELSNCSKKKVTEWSCALCEVSATSERGLQNHLAGKKHEAKVAGLKADHIRKNEKLVIKNSPESVRSDSNVEEKPEGESSGHKFKFWCRMCRAGFSNKKELNMHRKGVPHLTNQLNRAQKTRGKSGGRRRRV